MYSSKLVCQPTAKNDDDEMAVRVSDVESTLYLAILIDSIVEKSDYDYLEINTSLLVFD